MRFFFFFFVHNFCIRRPAFVRLFVRVQPINGWSSSEGMDPWRSPERAPEYGGDDSQGVRKGESYVRSASFAGDQMQARNTPWENR